MKKIFIILLLTLSLTVTVFAAEEDYQTITVKNISIDIPSEWTLEEIDNGETNTMECYVASDFYFAVEAFDTSEYGPLEDYNLMLTFTQSIDESFIDYQNYTVIETKDLSAGNLTSLWTTITSDDDGYEITDSLCYIVKENTMTAIRMQSDHSYDSERTAELLDIMEHSINSFSVVVYSDSATIKAVQQSLTDAGYECGNADGILGSKTTEAISTYEMENGLYVNGVITDELLDSLDITDDEINIFSSDGENSIEEIIAEGIASEELTAEETEILQNDGQITFRDIPWGTSYTDVYSILSDFNMWEISGEGFKTYSIDDITLGDYKGLQFENSDINIIGNTFNKNIDVAGYTTSDICLYFAYIPVDGVLTKTQDDSALYGARYVFEPVDLEGMAQDLTEKLTSIYGEPSDTKSDRNIYGVKSEYTFWTGTNDTELVMRTEDSSDDITGLYDDKIYLSYVWLKGDDLLQQASDILSQNNRDAEAAVFGSGKTNGL